MAGKAEKRRPSQVTPETYSDNWAKIFKKKKKKPKEIGVRKDGLEPTRYYDGVQKVRCIDF